MSNRADGARAAVVAEAESWIGTPYHHAARLKGVGCDCLTLLAEVFERAGVIAPVEVPFYPPDWHLHRSAELYMNGVIERAREIEHSPGSASRQEGAPSAPGSASRQEGAPGAPGSASRQEGAPSAPGSASRQEGAPSAPGPGDIALFRFGRCFAHGAIVTQWPRLIHAWHSAGVVADAADQPRLANRKVRFFSPFPTPDP